MHAPDSQTGLAPGWRFQAMGHHARPLRADEVPLLQALYEANPLYFETVTGHGPRPHEAQEAFDDRPPPDMPYRAQECLGLFRHDGTLVGVSIVVVDLMAPGVWHVALFLLATGLHGHGLARALYQALEAWALREGAQWMRLGVVVGNTRAEHFWWRRGFEQVRLREHILASDRVNTLRVMVKPLAGQPVAAYRAQVPRDRPETDLP